LQIPIPVGGARGHEKQVCLQDKPKEKTIPMKL
jgi:hypothetical protein